VAMTSRNGRSVVSLIMKTSMVCLIIGYNGVPRWYPDLKWERRGIWWLDTRHGPEHDIKQKVGKGRGRLLPSKAGKQVGRQARRKRRNGVVDLASRHEDGYKCGQLSVDN
jgi:hypothetical protein